jgi:hypothetical protein
MEIGIGKVENVQTTFPQLTECQQKLLVLKDIEDFHHQTVENNEVTRRANLELHQTLDSQRKNFEEHRLAQEKKYEVRNLKTAGWRRRRSMR